MGGNPVHESPLSAADQEFLRRFEQAEFGCHEFGHRQHLRMAWLYTRLYGPAEAEERAARGIRHLVHQHGGAQKYNDTLTRAWVRTVAYHVAQEPALGDFATFVARFPALTTGDLMLRHYSAAVPWSDEARAGWVEPDSAPLPI
jgi:hypothetical protein